MIFNCVFKCFLGVAQSEILVLHIFPLAVDKNDNKIHLWFSSFFFMCGLDYSNFCVIICGEVGEKSSAKPIYKGYRYEKNFIFGCFNCVGGLLQLL